MNSLGKKLFKLSATLLIIFTSFNAEAQSKLIINAFKLLPSELVYGMSEATKDSILKEKTYYPADNDSLSIVALNYGGSNSVKNYLYVSMSYETSQRASGVVEIRAFEMKGKKLIIVSNTGGVQGVNYQQNDISTFLYDGKNKLIPYKVKLVPNRSENLFLKTGIPDSIKKAIINNSNLTFDFSKEKVLLSVNSSFLLENKEYRKWMKGDQIQYSWTGEKFIAGSVYFSDENH